MSKKEEKVAQILNVAVVEFLSKGLDAASMHNISLTAEVSKRTLYKYYPTKDDLYNALVDELLASATDMYQFDYESEVDIETQVKNIVSTKIELTLTDSFLDISKIVIGEMLKGRSPSAEQLEQFYAAELLFIRWIEHGQKEGKISKDVSAEDIANQFHSIMKGQIYWPVLLGLENKSTLDLEKVKSTTTNFFRQFIL